ncbi:hypothetical protein AZI86_18095 [Bdellovibrio bacteriovorus]|uniref:Spermidine/putrescine ABC transporter substrate-binding protein n=1 Tax=Bdellovibrio bacteriovorus TaxID=959 RepID=A0A150WF24_BDEBC|nr:extracellular solute-binding protein [Bdellovibrio bacteriovorus]KYG61616.1 hypothetical protein AZI86_18095 [Bdellovibrio bacteriovorus]
MLKYFISVALISFTYIASAQFTTQSKQETVITCHYDEVLTMDVWTSYGPSAPINEFKDFIRKKYGKNVDLHVRRTLKPEDFYDRVRAGISDIISPSHNFLKDERTHFIKNNLIIPIDPEIVTNLKDVQTHFIENDFVTSKGKLYGVPLAAGPYGLLYNVDQIATAPTSWNILWAPEMKGRYSLSLDFYEANIYLTALAMGYKNDQLHDISLLNTKKFRLKLTQLLTNANFWQGTPHSDALKKSVLTTSWGLSTSISGPDAQKWRMAQPKEGVSMWVDYLAVTKNVRRNPFATTLAMEWANFVLGKSFQQTILEKKYLSPLKISSLPSMELESDIKYLSDQRAYWPVLTVRERNGLKLMYDQILAQIKKEKSR